MNDRTAAYELRLRYPRNIANGLMTAALFHILAAAGYHISTALTGNDVAFPRRFVNTAIDFIPPPPSLRNAEAMPLPRIGLPSGASVGVPVPVPDAEITPDATIATQEQMNTSESGIETGDPSGTVTIPDGAVLVDDGPPPAFVPVEKQPAVVRRVDPVYPELPRRAGVEGTVHVNMWVTKEGRVKQAVVVRSSSPMLDDAALEAARQWVFTPAVMNGGPVAVWVTVPFRFRLR